MSRLHLNFACSSYDRTALMQREQLVEGVDLNFIECPVEETFFRMLRYKEFDVAEMSLSSYTLSLFEEKPAFIAIPVFPSRFFRHSCIFVNANSHIEKPSDLVGKRIGTPEYQMTAPVWIRGILSDEYDVPVDSVEYVTGGLEEPDRPEKIKLNLPENIRVTRIGPGKTLTKMLADGEIDALHTARSPSCFNAENPHIRRLFPHYKDVEKAYYRRTRTFPIMHTVVIRRDIYEANRWVAQSLFKAFNVAQQRAYSDLQETAALKVMLPWLVDHLEETVNEMGANFWPYGLKENWNVLDTFLKYSFEQGLSARRLSPEDLFAEETFHSFKI